MGKYFQHGADGKLFMEKLQKSQTALQINKLIAVLKKSSRCSHFLRSLLVPSAGCHYSDSVGNSGETSYLGNFVGRQSSEYTKSFEKCAAFLMGQRGSSTDVILSVFNAGIYIQT